MGKKTLILKKKNTSKNTRFTTILVILMNNETLKIIDTISNERNLTPSTKRIYINAVKQYEDLHELTLTELLEEAEKEEEQGIRWKHRKLRQRLTLYQNYLLTNYKYGTVKNYLHRIKAIYNHYDIEIHQLPKLNKRQANYPEPITYQDLPTKETLMKAYKLMTPVMRAILLFQVSTGCSKHETIHRTITEYKEWIQPHSIDEILEDKIDIVPTIKTHRSKTNTYYYTFCTPECVREIAHYLQTRNDTKEVLFKIEPKYVSLLFQKYNDLLGLGRKNNMNLLRSHMLRKFHASRLSMGDYPLSLDEIDTLQGRIVLGTRASYYFRDTEELRKKYIRNIDQVTILDKVHTITVDSPEVELLKRKAQKIDDLEKIVKKIIEKNQKGSSPQKIIK